MKTAKVKLHFSSSLEPLCIYNPQSANEIYNTIGYNVVRGFKLRRIELFVGGAVIAEMKITFEEDHSRWLESFFR